MSLLEVLIASALILVIAVGLLPLLARSMINNAKGWRATESTSHARSSLEEFLEKDLGHADLAVAGLGTAVSQVYTRGSDVVGDDDEGWWDPGDIEGRGRPEWSRAVTIRQYNLADLSAPLGAGASLAYVHVKESLVELEAGEGDGDLLNEGRKLHVRVLKAF